MQNPYNKENSILQFSFLCSVCGKPIKTNTVVGDRCILIYFKNDIEVERLEGDYNGFGGVFTDKEQVDDKGKRIGFALERKKDFWKTSWDEILENHNDFLNQSSGICAIHKKCLNVEDLHISKSEYDERGGYGFYE